MHYHANSIIIAFLKKRLKKGLDYVKQRINDQRQHLRDHLFMTTTKMGRANEATKFLAVLQIVVDGFGGEGVYF